VEAVIRACLRSLHRGQSGLTVVEMIITMALTSIVMGAIFSVYLLLYRVQTNFEDKSQARSVGLVAEQRLQEDLQRYTVTKVSPDLKTTDLVLSAATSIGGPTFSVTYTVDKQNRLTRQATGDPRPTVVAHGINKVSSSCDGTNPNPEVTVQVWVDVSGKAVAVSPGPRVTLRNQSRCP
jgi:type II secretory pathway pseudopilin PulG